MSHVAPTRHTPRRACAALAGAALLCVAAACSTVTAVGEPALVRAEIDQPFSLRVGQRAEVATDAPPSPFRVIFLGVTGDSRCPADVQCIWEGDARLALRLELGAASSDTAAHTSGRFWLPPELEGHRVTVEGLAPQTRSGRTIPQGDYVATLRVTRTN